MTTDLEEKAFHLAPELLVRLEKCTNLPSPPVVAMRILDLSLDPDVDIGKVADVVSLDPALTVKILRIANSPLYAIRRKTENLRQAIMLLGLNGTLTMALSFSLASSIRSNASQGFNFQIYWSRSLAAATCCRRLCAASGKGTPEEVFLAGLLQDIGMLALNKMQPDFYAGLDVDQADHVGLQQKEREILGADHAAIGGWLLNKWSLPECLQYAVDGSHDLAQVDSSSDYLPYAQCVFLSGQIIDALSKDESPALLLPVLKLVKEQLGIEEAALATLLEGLNEDFAAAADLFDTDLDDYTLSESLIDQAKETLMLRNLQTIQRSNSLQEETAKLEDRTRQLEEKNRRDGLTGLFNRTHFNERMDEEFTLAKGRQWPLAIMFVDLDHFKRVNDTHGHQAGDLVLQEAARLLSRGTRDNDVVARYGGEEFIIILPGCGSETATIVANRLVDMFGSAVHAVNDNVGITVTASIGYSVIGEGIEFPDAVAMIGAADKAVYEAKNRGRDQVVAYSRALEAGAGSGMAAAPAG